MSWFKKVFSFAKAVETALLLRRNYSDREYSCEAKLTVLLVLRSRINGFLFLIFFFVCCLTGCSSPSKDKFLRTFFDGVPAPEEKKPVVEEKKKPQEKKSAEQTPAPKPTVFFHQPFAEQQCEACHEKAFSQKLIAKGKELCFNCHDDFSKGKKTVHYPVSEGQCSECHDPHQSPNKYMLKKIIPDICFTCHDEKEIRGKPAHEGQNNCIECHDPHASNEEKLIK